MADFSYIYAPGYGGNPPASGSTTSTSSSSSSSRGSSSGSNFGTTLVDNLGEILAGGGALVSAFNNKRTYTETRETKTVNFNNGTTIAVIIGAAVVIAVVAYALLRK